MMTGNLIIIFFLSLFLMLSTGIILYQQFAFRKGTLAKLRAISSKLKEIMEKDSDERIMLFTQNPELMELAAQINALLENNLRIKADYRRSQAASRKMLSNISHDIKTPLTVIAGYLEIMRINHQYSDKMLQKTEQKTQDVLTLINQFFTLAKIESGDMDIPFNAVNICEICRESVLDFYEILTSNDFQVEVSIPPEPIYLQSNQESIQRILSNLISNVIRYGADGKYLGVSLQADGDDVSIHVTDRGKGIDKQFAESIFERLFTMEDSRNRNIQGSGLGLTISKSLAIRLGGDIILSSNPHVETTFTLRLPRKKFVRFEQ